GHTGKVRAGIAPARPAVAADTDASTTAARVDHSCPQGRLGDGRQRMSCIRARARLAQGQVWTDRLPPFAGGDRAKQIVAAEVERARAVRRDEQRTAPVETIRRAG